jgi:hypothetical protein
MLALSIHQPYATLILLGVKRYETRSWRTAYRGPLLIHASHSYTEADVNAALQPAVQSVLRQHGYRRFKDLPRGAIIGSASLNCIRPTNDVQFISDLEFDLGNWLPGGYAWRIAHPTRWSSPVRANGSLGLFEVPDEILAVRAGRSLGGESHYRAGSAAGT